MQNDKNFIAYLSEELDQSFIENYFVSIKKSLPCLTQIRYIDTNGDEIIKITGNSINIFKEKAITRVANKNELKNRIKLRK